MNDVARAILYLLGEGHSVEDILRQRPDLTKQDVQDAARAALRIVEQGESREDRVARVRRQHRNAFEPWTDLEDKLVVDEFRRGSPIAAMARTFGRPPGAIRMRLQKLGIDPRRSVVKDAPSPPARASEHFEWTGGP